MICEINVETVVIGYFEVAGPENELGFAQNSFKSTLSQRRHLYYAKLYLSSIYDKLAEKHTTSSCTLNVLLNTNTRRAERRMQLAWGPFPDFFLIFIWQPQCHSAVTAHESLQTYTLAACKQRGERDAPPISVQTVRFVIDALLQAYRAHTTKHWREFSVCTCQHTNESGCDHSFSLCVPLSSCSATQLPSRPESHLLVRAAVNPELSPKQQVSPNRCKPGSRPQLWGAQTRQHLCISQDPAQQRAPVTLVFSVQQFDLNNNNNCI
jgi:hypothetical protein